MKRFVRSIDRISIWSGRGFSYLFVVAMLIIVYDVIARGIFNIPNVWTFDVALFCCGTVWVIGGAYVHYHKRHVRIDVLFLRLPPRTQAFLDLILTLPCLVVFCGVLVWVGGYRGVESFLANETLGSTWDPIVWPFRWMIPLGGVLILLQGLAKGVRDMYMAIKGERLD